MIKKLAFAGILCVLLVANLAWAKSFEDARSEKSTSPYNVINRAQYITCWSDFSTNNIFGSGQIWKSKLRCSLGDGTSFSARLPELVDNFYRIIDFEYRANGAINFILERHLPPKLQVPKSAPQVPITKTE